jgi:hypothetical protein
MFTFDHLDSVARSNSTYAGLALDADNNTSLELLADGFTAIVAKRVNGTWIETARFERETYFTGGHWSDVDIAQALESVAT